MKLPQAFEYAKALDDFSDFVEKHAGLLNEYNALQERLTQAEEALKERIRSTKTDLQIKNTLFKYIPTFKKWIDYSLALEAVGKKNKTILDDMTKFEAKVNFERFVEACRTGVLPQEAQFKAYKESEQTPRILITHKP